MLSASVLFSLFPFPFPPFPFAPLKPVTIQAMRELAEGKRVRGLPPSIYGYVLLVCMLLLTCGRWARSLRVHGGRREGYCRYGGLKSNGEGMAMGILARRKLCVRNWNWNRDLFGVTIERRLVLPHSYRSSSSSSCLLSASAEETTEQKGAVNIFEIDLPTNEDSETLLKIRHSTAHVMAMAVQKVYPEAKVTIGPWIDNG